MSRYGECGASRLTKRKRRPGSVISAFARAMVSSPTCTSSKPRVMPRFCRRNVFSAYAAVRQPAAPRRSASVGRSLRSGWTASRLLVLSSACSPGGANRAPFTHCGSPVKREAWLGQVHVPLVVTSRNATPEAARCSRNGVVDRRCCQRLVRSARSVSTTMRSTSGAAGPGEATQPRSSASITLGATVDASTDSQLASADGQSMEDGDEESHWRSRWYSRVRLRSNG